jgi:hypothetical protein
MKREVKRLRCAIYTRVSTEHGLEQNFNSLDAQREAAEAYIKSQAHEGWVLIKAHYDDGGFSGGSMDRPALQRLLSDVQAGAVNVVVVYNVDRLTRPRDPSPVCLLVRSKQLFFELCAIAIRSRTPSTTVTYSSTTCGSPARTRHQGRGRYEPPSDKFQA